VTDSVDIVVAGAGVVGLAIARALALSGREVVVLEAATAIGTGISSRNSEVVHAGIYYPAGSLKARLCVEGRQQLYDYCDARGIAAPRIGKLIVATSMAERAQLESIQARAEQNGVRSLRWLDAGEAQRLEPALSCVAALHSPETGIVDSHGLMLAYRGDAEAAGAAIAFNAPVLGGQQAAAGWVLQIGGSEPQELACRWFINAAGLDAVALARKLVPQAPSPPAFLCKGSYFTLAARAPFRHLIYPIPQRGGLGVHLTLDLAGQARFGPDTEWIDRIDYAVDPVRGTGFYEAIRRYWPDLPDDALQPGYSGIRPKIVGPDQPDADFRLDGPHAHGVRGLINLFGIESPGLTASLAIGARVSAMVDEYG